ncbi:hypothetical protein J6590_106397, partial [Homalodisca vitripennis]
MTTRNQYRPSSRGGESEIALYKHETWIFLKYVQNFPLKRNRSSTTFDLGADWKCKNI